MTGQQEFTAMALSMNVKTLNQPGTRLKMLGVLRADWSMACIDGGDSAGFPIGKLQGYADPWEASPKGTAEEVVPSLPLPPSTSNPIILLPL